QRGRRGLELNDTIDQYLGPGRVQRVLTKHDGVVRRAQVVAEDGQDGPAEGHRQDGAVLQPIEPRQSAASRGPTAGPSPIAQCPPEPAPDVRGEEPVIDPILEHGAPRYRLVTPSPMPRADLASRMSPELSVPPWPGRSSENSSRDIAFSRTFFST